jgi:hypothetical protein
MCGTHKMVDEISPGNSDGDTGEETDEKAGKADFVTSSSHFAMERYIESLIIAKFNVWKGSEQVSCLERKDIVGSRACGKPGVLLVGRPASRATIHCF